jgi:hypothetical protein
MKKILVKSSLVLVTILLFITACEKGPIMFDTSIKMIGFSTSSVVVKEDVGGAAYLYLAAVTGTEATTITLTVDTVGLGKAAAKEGIDFNLSSKSVPVNVGETAVTITPVNNSVFTGDKKFYIVITGNSKNYTLSTQKRFLVTIADDEHPLKAWIGTYSVAAASYGKPGAWDESWTVITAPVEGDVTKLSLKGIGASSANTIYAVFDKDALTITISKGQNVGDVYGYGEIKIYYGFDDLSLDMDADITGTLNLNGTIHIDHWGENVTDPTGDWVWDVFNTTWTK